MIAHNIKYQGYKWKNKDVYLKSYNFISLEYVSKTLNILRL